MADDKRNKNLALALSGLGDIVRAGAGPNVQPVFQKAVMNRIAEQEAAQGKLQQIMGIELFKEQLRANREPEVLRTLRGLGIDLEGGGGGGSLGSSAINRGILKKATGIELPPSPEERQQELANVAEEEKTKVKARKEAERDVKVASVRKDLDSYFALDEVVQGMRATGGLDDRIVSGLKIKARGFNQKSPEGKAIAARSRVVKNLRTAVARLRDVGNLSRSEQEAAEFLFPSDFDTQGTAQIKNAFLKDLTSAIDRNDATGVQQILQTWQISPEFQEAKENFNLTNEVEGATAFNSIADAEASSLPDGSFITINGRPARLRR